MKSTLHIIFFLIAAAIVLGSSSCKVHVLFQDKANKGIIDSVTFLESRKAEYIIRKDDKVNMSIWNHDDLSIGSLYGIYNSNEVYGKWVLVDQKGFVSLPQVGLINIEGLTITEAEKKVAEEYSKFILAPVIKLKILNREINILGEVRNPGTFTLEKEHVTLLEMLPKSGALEFYADMKHVKLLRLEGEIYKSMIVDMTDLPKMNATPIFLKAGDIVYVPPRQGKMFDRKITNIIPVASLITTVGILLGYLAK